VCDGSDKGCGFVQIVGRYDELRRLGIAVEPKPRYKLTGGVNSPEQKAKAQKTRKENQRSRMRAALERRRHGMLESNQT
jgi:hypothetical protein